MMKPGDKALAPFMGGAMMIEEFGSTAGSPVLTLLLPETVEDGVRIPAQSMVIPSYWVRQLYERLQQYYGEAKP